MDVIENIGLVHKVLERMSIPSGDYDDYLQDGTIGLIKASRKYNPEKARFSTFAYYCIRNEVLRSIKKNNKNIWYVDNDVLDSVCVEDVDFSQYGFTEEEHHFAECMNSNYCIKDTMQTMDISRREYDGLLKRVKEKV